MYRHGDLYIYMIFLQKSFLSTRSEEELEKKKKKRLFWRWPSKTGMKYKFNQSNLIVSKILVVGCSFVLESLKAVSIGSCLIIPTTLIPIGRLEIKSDY